MYLKFLTLTPSVEKNVNLYVFRLVFEHTNYSGNVDHKGMAAHLTRSECGRFKCCTSKGMDGTDYMLWDDSEEDGNVRSVRKMKAPTVNMERVTMIVKGRQTLTCFVY
jgi:hypothetical protein